MFTVSRLAGGLAQPLFVTSPPGDTQRLFVVEQKSGSIKIINSSTGAVNSTPFLSIPQNVLLGADYEQGLLGLAFHPDYATNGKFYVNYTAQNGTRGGQTRIVEYQVSSSDPNVANPSSAKPVLSFNQPETNHNGGWMGFGPDGFLYISSGDGGGNGYQNGQLDQSFNSQDLTDNPLGKILRIDINGDAFPGDSTRNYRIPANNPFVGREGDDEIWSYGLRNPWRPSFDRATGDLFIADVGQSAQEEVNFQPAGVGGQNYGWNRFEGFNPYRPVSTPESLTSPVYAYDHSYGRSITGGYVYRGPAPDLQGEYIFGDFGTGKIASFNVSALPGGIASGEVTQRTAQFRPNTGTINNISSFGEDSAGNLYIVDYDGEIFRVNAGTVTPPPPAGGTGTGLKGEYFNNADFTAPVLTRTDPTVNFDWGSGSPSSSIGVDTFSARWTGQVEAPVSGVYTFSPTTDDGVRLFVDNQLIVNRFLDQSATESNGTISLVAGQKYDIKLEYYENGGDAVSQLAWTIPGFARQIIPQSRLYSESTTTPPPPPPTGGAGTGLKAEYFNNMDFTAPVLTRTDATVDFDWGSGSPNSAIESDTFSARWTGQVEAPSSGSYTFSTTSDDGVKLFVNNQLVIDRFYDQSPTEWSGTISLEAGKKYDIRMEYYENGGGAVSRLAWAGPGFAKQIIPQSRLFAPGAVVPPTPAPTALRFEGEAMDSITGFRSENIASASGGRVLSLVGGASGETGGASFTFAGATGKYDVLIGTFDETDGIGTFAVTRNGAAVGSATLNRNLGFDAPRAETMVRVPIVSGLSLQNGDRFAITGSENGGEFARLDFVDLVPSVL